MAIKAIISNTEKEIEQIKNSNEQDIDYVYSRIGDTEVEGEPPISIKSIGGNLADYRIYGNTVDGESVGDRTGNLFDMKTFAETCFQFAATVNYTNNALTFTATGTDSYVNAAFSKGAALPLHYHASCIDVLPSTTYTISMSVAPRCFISWIDTSFNVVSNYAIIPTNATAYTFTTPENCTKLLIRFGKQVTNIGDTFTISDIMLNTGSTPLPYEPYGYKVPVMVEGKNLWSGVVEQGAISILGNYEDSSKRIRSKNIPLEPGTYKLTSNLLVRMIFAYHDSTKFGKMFDVADGSENPSFTVPEGANNISVAMMKLVDGAQVDITPEDFEYGQIEKGSEATPYEPYHAPVTTSIYLPEQIRKVGDEAEYVDYAEQKMHRIGADDIDVALPALSTIKGTNTLSVNTSIQPSNMYIKDNFDYKKVFTATRTIEGESPLNYRSIEDNDSTLKNYRIYGQTSRNLFDENLYDKNVANNIAIYVPIYVGNVDYVTCSTTCPKTINKDYPDNDNFNSRYIFILSGNVNARAINDVNGVSNGAPRTIQPSNGYVTIAYRKIESYNISPWEYQTMLNVGSTALPYEPYGESVGDKTANILPLSRTPITETHGDFLCEYDGLGTITLTTDKDNAATDGVFVIPLIQDFTIPVSVGQGGTGCLQINNDCYGSAFGNISFVYNSTTIDGWSLNALNRIHSSYSILGNKIINKIAIYIVNSISYRKITIRPAFVENVTELVPFEPYGYKIPITNNSENANIYLDEPLRKVDYIDYATQKRHNSDGTESSVTLPAISTLTGTNTLTVGTEVQPSSVEIKGHIK